MSVQAVTGAAPGALSYWDWQRLVQEEFLRPQESPEPFMMFVDDDEMRRLWPSEPDPAAGLAEAVSGRLHWSGESALFARIDAEAERWRRSDRRQPPPTLPLLAVTVLAASRMHRDADASSSAYFLRLAQLLRPEATGKHVRELRRQISGSFGPVVQMWVDLHEWVSERRAKFGTSTIDDDPRLARIGYALSQALVKQGDRIRLTSFFAAMDLAANGIPEPEALLRYLTVWMSRPRGLSTTFRKAVADPGIATILEKQLHRLAAGWDGRVLAVDGRRRLDIRLVIDLDDFSARWAIPVTEDIDEELLATSDGQQVRLTRPSYGTLYCLSGELPAVAEGLKHGVIARGTRCTATRDPRPVLALREDASAAGWLEVSSMEPFEEHMLVIQPALCDQLERALSMAAEKGWKQVSQRGRPLLSGLLIYRKVILSDGVAFENAMRGVSPALANGLRPDPTPRPKLCGGLPLGRRLGKNYFLRGGEPDLVLPVGTEPRRVKASLDGIAQDQGLLATGFPIELSRLGPFEPGPHELIIDGEKLEFHLLDSLPEAPIASNRVLCWPAASGYTAMHAGGAALDDVCGASLPGDARCPVMVRRGVEAWLVDRYGGATRVVEPAQAEAFTSRDVRSYYVAVQPGPDDAWLVQARRGCLQPPQLVRWQQPHFSRLDNDSALVWQRLATAGDQGSPMWGQYLKAWQAWASR